MISQTHLTISSSIAIQQGMWKRIVKLAEARKYSSSLSCFSPHDPIPKKKKKNQILFDLIAQTCLHSYAITDITVPKDDNDHKTIWLCPLFFTGDQTKNDLPDTEDADKLKAWCDQKDYTLFPTAGMPHRPKRPLFMLVSIDKMTPRPYSPPRNHAS